MSSTPTARTSAAALVLAAVLLPSAAAHAATTPTPNKAQVEHSEGLLATTAPALTKAQVEQAERAAGAGPADVPADSTTTAVPTAPAGDGTARTFWAAAAGAAGGAALTGGLVVAVGRSRRHGALPA